MTHFIISNQFLATGSAPPLFSLLAVMLASVVMVSLLLVRVRQSLLIGYFLCGIVIANTGVIELLGGGDTHEAVRQMAEFGVLLLMFVLGMEFSIGELKYLRRFALLGGGLQMTICVVIGMLMARFFGIAWPGAIIIGVVLGMSSTAVSLKTFQDLGLSGSPGAQFALAVAIFQDLFIIAFLVFLPILLHGSSGDRALLPELGFLLLRGGAFVTLAWINARWVIPKLLHAVALSRSRELFSLTVVGFCVGLAFVGGLLGLSLALGAFVAGLAVSESVYKHRILADVQPIKDIFLTLFFVSVGLLIDVKLAMLHWQAILLLTGVLVLVKAAIVSGIALSLGQLNRPALLGGLSLCSAGEFSLLLLQKTEQAELWEPFVQQALVASATISMGLVPALMRLAIPLASWLNARGWGRPTVSNARFDGMPMREKVKHLSSHAIICGYGPVGRALNRALLAEGMMTLIIELNAETVDRLMQEGQSVLFADAGHEETWALSRVADASLVVFTFPQATTTFAALEHVRNLNPEVSVIARAAFASDQDRMENLGANIVIHDEGEAARAIAESALRMTTRSDE